MSVPRWILPSLAGVIAGATLVAACSDDSPGDADAAVCDCDPAEAPIAGRIMSVTGTTSIAPGSSGGQIARCPAGAVLLGGGCRLGLGVSDFQVHISIAAPDTAIPNSFLCEWGSNSAQTHTGTAEAICLVPPQ